MLVAGSAGAVGHAAIQLARWAGARVITTISGPVKEELARNAGADHVINYRTQDAATEIRALAPGGVDLVVEVAPAVNAALNTAVIHRFQLDRTADAHAAVEAGVVGKVLIDVG